MSEGRVSCIVHSARERLAVLRPAYVTLCDGNVCAALMISVLEYWTNVRLSNAEERSGDLWVYRTREELAADLCGAFGRDAITAATKLLERQGVIERRRNRNKGWDRTWQYRLNLDLVQDAIGLSTHSRESAHGVADQPQIPMDPHSRPSVDGDLESGENPMNKQSRVSVLAKTDIRPSKDENPSFQRRPPVPSKDGPPVEQYRELREGEEQRDLTLLFSRVRPHLARAASQKSSPLPADAELASIAEEFPGIDLVDEAERFAEWHAGEGKGAPLSNFARCWRQWLRNAPPAGERHDGKAAKPWRADPDAEDQHAERLDWAREHLPDLEPELVAGCYLTALGRYRADRGPEPTPELIRQRLEAQGRAKAVA